MSARAIITVAAMREAIQAALRALAGSSDGEGGV